tara:strand:- start:8436 stop:9236 length:801 start_codon:yes stop_codon:yes gene_type:complete
MSLASAQRNLAQANRKALKIQGEAKMGQSLLETASQGLQMGMAIGDSVFDLTEKKQAWKDYSAGREYMGLDKADAPTLKQRLFKRPEDVYSNRTIVGDKEYTAKEIQSVGTLASSKNRALYEKMMDGNLASSLGRESLTNLELQNLDASGAYKDMGKRELEPYMGEVSEGGSSYESLEKTMPSKMFSKSKDVSDYELTQRQVRKAMKANKNNFDLARENYFQTLNEEYGLSISQEEGQSYWDELIAKRNNLRTSAPIESKEKELGR